MSKPITIEVMQYSRGAIKIAEVFNTHSFKTARVMLERLRQAYPPIVIDEFNQVQKTHLIRFNSIYSHGEVNTIHNYKGNTGNIPNYPAILTRI